MLVYSLKRLALALLTVLAAAFLTFWLMNAIPGSPFYSEKYQTPAVVAELEAKYGLDQPLLKRFVTYISGYAQGDMGVSLKMQKGRPVAEIIREKLPLSAGLGLLSLAWALAAGVLLGMVAACGRGGWADALLRTFATLGVAVPGFVLAALLLLLFGVVLKILPTWGLMTWQSYLLPSLALGLYPMCYILRLTRASMLETLGQAYIQAARLRGLDRGRLLFKHALRGAILPVLTYSGPLTAYLITGSFVVESVFSIPGLGRFYVQSVLARDYPLIMAALILLAAVLVLMVLLVDILYHFVDPRIKLSQGGAP